MVGQGGQPGRWEWPESQIDVAAGCGELKISQRAVSEAS